MKRSLQHFAAATGGHLQGADRTFTAVSTDSRTLPAGALFVALVGPSFDGHDFLAQAAERGAAGAIVQRRCDSSLPQIVVGDTLRALQDAAQAWRNQFALPVVAVAGSNGKTTTKELAAAILRETGPCLSTQGTLNNHIGVPLTLLGLDEVHRTAVIEIGANHPGEVAALVAIARPTVGLVTNAGAEHLEGFGDLDGVARAEGEMFAGLEPGATAILNADDAYADLWRTMNRADRVVTFGLEAAADFGLYSRRESIRAGSFVQELELRTPAGQATVELQLAGRHNASNALAAAAATSAAGAGLEAIVQGLGRAVPVKGRLQPKAARGGAWLIDDSYNANPSSVRAGLDVLAELQGERWLVLGDMGELGEHAVAAHTEAGSYARERGVTRLYAVGTLTPHAVRAFGAGATSYADPTALVEALRPALRPGVNVLVKGSRSNRLERVVEALRNTDDAA